MDLHGGNIYRLKRENRIDKEFLDFSANINPLGLPKGLKNLITNNLDNILSYPDPDYIELKQEISKHNYVDSKYIIPGNGATELIFLAIKTLNPKKALIISPTFAEYERALKQTDAEISYFKLKENYDFIPNLEYLKSEIKKGYDLVIICNPNNPTGLFLKPAFIKNLVDSVDNKTKIMIDEAFIDFIEDYKNLSSNILKSDKLIIIRAFTKFFAIPGLRLGYLISRDRELNKKINKNREPWTINSFAEIAGKSLLNEDEYIKQTYHWIKEEKEFIYMRLKEFETIKVFKPSVNFVLIKLFKTTSNELRDKMIQHGVIIRDCQNFKNLDNSYIRLAIRSRKENLEMLKILNKFIK